MSRGRKPASFKVSNNWEDIFWNGLPTYIGILNNYFKNSNNPFIEIGESLEKLSFKLPKGLNSKEIKPTGIFPVISQSKDFIIGYSDREDLLVKNDLPLIIFGDHSKTIKYVDKPFVIGADGVKLIKPKKIFDERFLYYFLHGAITDTKDYGRHFGLLRKRYLPKIKSIEVQKSVVKFLDNLKTNSISTEKEYFNKQIEDTIFSSQANQINGSKLQSELAHQQDLLNQLRQSFLREAIQGKLVKQDEKDGDAKQLLQKIKSEKEKLIAEKKLKKEKELPPIKEEEIPFHIPENWVWCRLGEVGKISGGGTPSMANDKYWNGNIPWVSPKDMWTEFVVDTEMKVTNKAVAESSTNLIPEGSLLIVGRSGILKRKLPVAIARVECTVNQDMKVIAPHIISMNRYLQFMLFGLESIVLKDFVKFGMTVHSLKYEEFSQMPIPLPPLAEQKRIVKKLEEVMNVCDELKTTIADNQKYTNQLLQVALKDALQMKEEIVV